MYLTSFTALLLMINFSIKYAGSVEVQMET